MDAETTELLAVAPPPPPPTRTLFLQISTQFKYSKNQISFSSPFAKALA